jgi:glycerol uptake operon antiterminator
VHFDGQKVIPAARTVKDFEELLVAREQTLILLNAHLAQIPRLVHMAHQSQKKVFLHADFVQGLKQDEAGAQFLCQVVRPDGIISTHSNVVVTARKHRVTAIQRIFLLDSHSLETSYRVLQASQPDYIEVLPGLLPEVLREVAKRSGIPMIAGGFIKSAEDVATVLNAGAVAVTTSTKSLWSFA